MGNEHNAQGLGGRRCRVSTARRGSAGRWRRRGAPPASGRGHGRARGGGGEHRRRGRRSPAWPRRRRRPS